MNQPIEEYEYYKNIKGISELAYYNLFEKYFKLNLYGENKKIDIEDTDQESLLVGKYGGFPIPGIIYTFVYGLEDVIKPENQSLLKKLLDIGSGEKKFIDLIPLTFCLNVRPDGFTGINLNMLPPSARVAFLQTLYTYFKDFLEREAELLAQNNKLSLNKRFISLMGEDESRKVLAAFNKRANENFPFAFRKYSYQKISRFRIIEYSEWKYIPHYEPKDAFKKLSLSAMYKLYNDSKK